MTESVCSFCGLTDKHHCRTHADAERCPEAPPERKPSRVQTGPLRGLKRLHYGAIVVDPPWSFLTRSDKGKGRSPERHYNCMTLDQIKALPIREIAANDCALFLWAIDTHLPVALDVLDAWGFTYKTRAFTWAKLNRKYHDYQIENQIAHKDRAWFKGMGFWTRANTEDCLLATRGHPKRLSKAVRRLIVSPVREHSRKPAEALQRVENLVAGPYLEIFSRESRAGWDHMGQEAGKFDPISSGEEAEIKKLI